MLLPYLLLDIDGVLAIKGRAPTLQRHQVVDRRGLRPTIWLNPQHRVWLAELRDIYELVWATGWENEAARLLAPLLDLPPMPVIMFRDRPSLGATVDKLPDVADFAGTRALAWVDDDMDEAELAWASARKEPTLLIKTDATIGLTRAHAVQLLEFAGG